MIREHFEYRTTITTILAEDEAPIGAAKEAMVAARQEVEAHLAADPFFGMTLEPYIPETQSLTVSRMAKAGSEAGVGPMAAVAGSIAWAGVEAMQDAGAVFGVIDNGGDIAIISDRDVRIGLYAGGAPAGASRAFILPKQSRIYGICTSSASVGPSISFGTADAVTVFARDVSLADAWATSLCNRTGTGAEGLFSPLEHSGVDGAYVVMGDETTLWGKVPPVVPARVDESLISAGHGGTVTAHILRKTQTPGRKPPSP
jgi:ApbE superfamily uncharacterized protein (UPF0280 family)